MFFLPNFNLKSYSDEQLLEKMADLSKRIMFFSYSSNGGCEMLMQMLEAFRQEYSERQFMDHWRLYGSAISKPIETEPDLKRDSKQEDGLKRGEKPKRKRMEILTRSEKPVVPDRDI